MLRLIFFGMTGVFSLPPLEKLLEAVDIEVRAVVLPAVSPTWLSLPRLILPQPPSPADIPLLNPHLDHNIVHLAWAHDIPVWEVGSLSDPDTLALLSDWQPDLIVVACFSQLMPVALLRLPPYGCLNLHPSLLPAYRGPTPLFWLARQGETQAGVTLHFLDEGTDTGDIVARTAFVWPEGLSEAALNQHCAMAGAELLLTALAQLEQQGTLPRRAQPALGASYHPWPGQADFRVPTTWTARRAFNFLRFSQKNWPLWVDTGQKQIFIRTVMGYDMAESLGQPLLWQGDELWLQFSPGVVKVIPERIFA